MKARKPKLSGLGKASFSSFLDNPKNKTLKAHGNLEEKKGWHKVSK